MDTTDLIDDAGKYIKPSALSLKESIKIESKVILALSAEEQTVISLPSSPLDSRKVAVQFIEISSFYI